MRSFPTTLSALVAFSLLLGTCHSAQDPNPKKPEYEVGARVSVKFHGRWYPAIITDYAETTHCSRCTGIPPRYVAPRQEAIREVTESFIPEDIVGRILTFVSCSCDHECKECHGTGNLSRDPEKPKPCDKDDKDFCKSCNGHGACQHPTNRAGTYTVRYPLENKIQVNVDEFNITSLECESAAKEPDARREDNEQFLRAAKWGYYIDAQSLLAKGVDVNTYDKCRYGTLGNTALHLAVQRRDPITVQQLLDHNADVNRVNAYKQTPLHYAASVGWSDVVVKLLLDNGANIDPHTNRVPTPLQQAAIDGKANVVRLLCARGADMELMTAADDNVSIEGEPKYKKAGNGNALHFACRYGHRVVVDILLAAGSDIEARTRFGLTPLHRAATHGQAEMVQLLVDRVPDEG